MITEEYKQYNPTAANTSAVIKILAAEHGMEDWEVMKELVLDGCYVSPSEEVKKSTKEKSPDILEDIVKIAEEIGFDRADEIEQAYKRASKSALILTREMLRCIPRKK